jgi:hypothetical protein
VEWVLATICLSATLCLQRAVDKDLHYLIAHFIDGKQAIDTVNIGVGHSVEDVACLA